ncbi:hypothetical protein Ga0609869_003403 [Rhodovulum iodosum]|uniref:Phytase-like domain-containing protein n=1 Tax=Rhodovulum iodosum TaxID=68291 RepID=A0ABV3XXH6_9RHOB|nr:esterase-like activity of phytase family protein [Rhodovulum robiginosum]RSK40204.1 esterase-like activity of phytase family protein [Rhodovulum robiginosum]
MRASARGALILVFLGLAALAGVPAPELAHARHAGSAWAKAPDLGIGGLSGLELSPDGASFAAISDRGFFVTGRLSRQDGRLTGLAGLKVWPMRGPGGGVLTGADAEGLARGADGALYVSFEGTEGGVMRFEGPDAPGRPLPYPAGFAPRHDNRGLELLSAGPDGTLFSLPEWPAENGRFPVFRFIDGAWTQPFSIAAESGFSPVGGDFGPDGHFYLLERQLIAPVGFRSRVRRFDRGPGDPGAGRVILATPPGRHGNLEGLSVWRDGDGRIRLSMVSDDNFLALQRGQIVEYVLDAGGPAG